MKVENWQLKQRQSLSLDNKITMTKRRIRDWYEYWKGESLILRRTIKRINGGMI